MKAMMRKKKRLSTLLVAVVLVAGMTALYGCGKQESSPTAQKQGPEVVVIGGIYPLTGPMAAFGQSARIGLEDGVQYANETILAGTKYRLIAKAEDSKGDPQTGVLAYRRVVDGDRARICNVILSNVGVALKPLADAEGVLLFADSTHSSLRDGTTLRHSQTADQEAEFLIAYCSASLAASSIVAVVSDDDYGASFSKAIGAKAQVLRYDPKSPDLKAIALKAAGVNSDAIIFVGVGGPLGEIIRTVREGGYKGQLLATVAFDVVPSTRQVAGDAAKGLSYPRLVQNPDELKGGTAAGQATNALAGVSAIKVIAFNDAVFVAKALAAGKTQPKDIRAFLLNQKQIDGVGTTVIPRPDGALLPRLEMTKVQ